MLSCSLLREPNLCSFALRGFAAAIFTSKQAPRGQVDSEMREVLKIGIRCSAWSAQQAEAVALILLTRSISDLLQGHDLIDVFHTAPAEAWMRSLQ